ncbi:uncharacterized protein LOC119066338 [Bradysia coprophila]|uniref:uncharacterized protein LOC119066338 n=1 Tax=Bradysia coprophila TaxID=38358 RepID=UPI00187D96FE|nr:uncharacterized protein LOC119066338 [Bradysia coprophila]
MALPEKLLQNYKKFQAPNNIPVWLKGGQSDKILFGITVAGCGLGVLGYLQMLYTMGFKKKNQ